MHSSLLSLGAPIFITIIAAWLLKERFTFAKALGLICGIGGAALLVLMKDTKHTGDNILLGDCLVLINAITYSFYLVMVRPLMAKYSSIQVMRWIFTIGAIGILPFGLPELLSTNWHAFETSHFISLAYIAVAGTFVAYLLTVYSISAIGSSATGAFIYMQPIFAAILAAIFMGEQFSITKGIAAFLIFTGVYLVNFKKVESPAAVDI